jgi:hypothetical protein
MQSVNESSARSRVSRHAVDVGVVLANNLYLNWSHGCLLQTTLIPLSNYRWISAVPPSSILKKSERGEGSMTMVVQVFCTVLVVRFSRVRFFDALPKRTWSIVIWSDASDAVLLPEK